ncbi:unnamed protein product [Thelazia callipaeda]|uniref:Reticulon-like protein n=1 Tax=Thelazia callipaeda TaxID=103827 RepID=A0A0N5DC67_THECL|nr:unnamed protein product [Thelazia callipaeda]
MSAANQEVQSPSSPDQGSDKIAKNVKKAVRSLDIVTVGSDKIGQGPNLGLKEWINLVLDRECTPVLYVYFAGIAILAVITALIIVIIGLYCDWEFASVF